MVVEIVDSGVASVITMWEFIKQIDKQLSTYNAKEHHFWIDGVFVSDMFLSSKTKDNMYVTKQFILTESGLLY